MNDRLKEINDIILLVKNNDKKRKENIIINKILRTFPILNNYIYINGIDVQIGMIIRYVNLLVTTLSSTYIVVKIKYHTSFNQNKQHHPLYLICVNTSRRYSYNKINVLKHYFFYKEQDSSDNRYYIQQLFNDQINKYIIRNNIKC